MADTEPVNKDFEFDCPQFTDFTANLDNVSEEFCQNYFDKKTEEIKRNSLEFDKENIEFEKQTETEAPHDTEDKENTKTDPPMNLLSSSFFANTSAISTKSSSSCAHYPTHCASNNLKNAKSRNQLTTEEMELQAMKQRKLELEKLRERNAKNVANMKEEHRVFHPIRSTKLTIPITPSLHTTIRAKQRLRKDKQRKVSDTNHKKRKASYNPNPTVPQSFKLSKTKKRRTGCTALSTEEKELKEIQKHGTFQARKINPKIFQANAANIGILNNIKNNKMSTTTVQPFNLLTEKRAQKHNSAAHTHKTV
eukprot:262702_1